MQAARCLDNLDNSIIAVHRAFNIFWHIFVFLTNVSFKMLAEMHSFSNQIHCGGERVNVIYNNLAPLQIHVQ